MEQSINLTDLDVHGKVYMDQEFGGRVCVLGNKVAYVAEAKDKKNTPFPQMSVTAPKEKEKDPGTFGQEYK